MKGAEADSGHARICGLRMSGVRGRGAGRESGSERVTNHTGRGGDNERGGTRAGTELTSLRIISTVHMCDY